MTSFKSVLAGCAAAALLCGASAASAATVYSEDFNSAAFVGSNLNLDAWQAFSDRWVDTSYYNIINADGWTFTGSAYLAKQDSTSDGALLLNETTGMATTILGLTPLHNYTLSLLLSGDNRPGSAYVFNISIDGNLHVINGVDLLAGTNPGTPLSYNFTASGSSVDLALWQAGSTEASPIVDNIQITSVPEPASWALMIGGFGMAGAMLRQRRALTAA